MCTSVWHTHVHVSRAVIPFFLDRTCEFFPQNADPQLHVCQAGVEAPAAPLGGGLRPSLGPPPNSPPCSRGPLAPPRNREAPHGIKLLITVINERGGSRAPWAGNPAASLGMRGMGGWGCGVPQSRAGCDSTRVPQTLWTRLRCWGSVPPLTQAFLCTNPIDSPMPSSLCPPCPPGQGRGQRAGCSVSGSGA